MQLQRHTGPLALVIAGLALLVAAGGTAYAVTATTVNIADPSTSSHIAQVDSSGHLLTAEADTTIDATTSFFSLDNAISPVTSPTTSTLAITELNYDNSYNISFANTNYKAELLKITVGSNGNCYDSDSTDTVLRDDSLLQGGSAGATFPAPIVVRPTAGKPYCIGAQLRIAGNAAPQEAASVSVTIGAYVAGGSYTGNGIGLHVGPNPSAPMVAHHAAR